jgi:thymidylate kinase
MIIVEGPDGAGKTTLVRQLVHEFAELKIGLRGTDNRDFLWKVTVHDTMKALSDFALSHGKINIWDRLFYSELVYAPLGMPPRKVEFNEAQQMHIRRIIDSADFPVILCLPPKQVVIENILEERHQMEGVREKAGAIYDAYHRLWSEQVFPERTMLYDYTMDAIAFPAVRNEVQDYIESKRERSW